MSETSRKIELWLDKGRRLTRNDLADFLAELDAAGAVGDTPVDVHIRWWSGAVRGLFAQPVTRGDPVPLTDPVSDWDALVAGDDSRPPFPGRPPDWYEPRPGAGPHPGQPHSPDGPQQCVSCFMLAHDRRAGQAPVFKPSMSDLPAGHRGPFEPAHPTAGPVAHHGFGRPLPGLAAPHHAPGRPVIPGAHARSFRDCTRRACLVQRTALLAAGLPQRYHDTASALVIVGRPDWSPELAMAFTYPTRAAAEGFAELNTGHNTPNLGIAQVDGGRWLGVLDLAPQIADHMNDRDQRRRNGLTP